MAIFSFSGAQGVRMTSFSLGFLKDMVIDDSQSTRLHWAGPIGDFTLTGTDLQATVTSGHLTGLTGSLGGLFATFFSSPTNIMTSVYDLTLDGATFYNLYAAKDWHGLLDLVTSGRDEIHGTAGRDVLSGGAGGDLIQGMKGSDNILGGKGNDTLYGDDGSDTMVGGLGDDRFGFDSAIGKSVDVISDFSRGDSILLWRAFFADIGSGDNFRHAFEVGAAATSANTRVFYDAATGDLSYDQDGSGTAHAAIVFAHLDAGLSLTYHDFTLTN